MHRPSRESSPTQRGGEHDHDHQRLDHGHKRADEEAERSRPSGREIEHDEHQGLNRDAADQVAVGWIRG
jgi:hypothetical protein